MNSNLPLKQESIENRIRCEERKTFFLLLSIVALIQMTLFFLCALVTYEFSFKMDAWTIFDHQQTIYSSNC